MTETNTEGYSGWSRWPSQRITEGQRASGKLWDLLDSGLGTLEITLLLNNTSVMFPFRVSMENVYKEENHFTSRKKSQLDSPMQLRYRHNAWSTLPNDWTLERRSIYIQ